MKNQTQYLEAAKVMAKFQDKVSRFNRDVSNAGFGYILGDDLTKLLNMCPWREAEEACILIKSLEEDTGVKFPWGNSEY